MMFMVFFVLHDPSQLNDILNAWEECGVSGVTILPSTGMARIRQHLGFRDDLPLIPSADDLLERWEDSNRTLFTLVPDQKKVDEVVAATQRVVGDLDLPNTGILAVLPVAQVYGLNRKA
mgnify:CR=1 FL=1